MGKVLRLVASIVLLVVAVTIAPILLPFAISFFASSVGAMFAKLPKPQPLNFRQTIGNSWIVIGKRRVGGQLIFYHGKKIGSTHYRYFVFAVAGHRCKGVTRWWLKDEEVTLDGAGTVTNGDYAGDIGMWFYRGTPDQVANPVFVAECDGKWTNDHRGRDVALIYVKAKMSKDAVAAGMPTFTAEVEGSDEIVDPRTGTPGYTRLAIPAIYWWMQLPREEGGFGARPDEIPDDDLLSAWTNVCDEDVPLSAGGTEKRYELDCLIETGGSPSQVRDDLVRCIAGTHCASEGVFLIRPGYWVPSTAHLYERDLDGAIQMPLLADPDQIANEVHGSFIDPTNLYQPQQVPVRTVPGGASIIQAEFELKHVTSHTRGQRILEIMLRRSQCERRVTWPMNVAGLELSAMQVVTIATDRHQLSNYSFVIDDWSISSNYRVVLQLREENPDIYAWSTAMEKPLASTPTISAGEPVPIDAETAVSATTAETATTAGSAAVAGAVGTYDAAALAALEARIEALEP